MKLSQGEANQDQHLIFGVIEEAELGAKTGWEIGGDRGCYQYNISTLRSDGSSSDITQVVSSTTTTCELTCMVDAST